MKELPRSIREAADLLRKRELSAVELADASRGAAHPDRHNAWLHIAAEHSRRQARAADERLKSGDAPPLTGIPWACKDIIGTKGIPTTAGSRILEGYLPAYSATVVDRLDAQGAVVTGEPTLDALAMGSSTENPELRAGTNPSSARRG